VQSPKGSYDVFADKGFGRRQRRAKPARSKRLDPESRRHAIINAAANLFATKGYAATSLEQIVAEAGGSLSSVYQLFGNKEGLWRAIVDVACARVRGPITDELEHADDLRAQLKAYAVRLDGLERSPMAADAIRLVLAEVGKFPELARTLFESGPDVGRRLCAAFLDKHVAAGELDISDTLRAAEQLTAMICDHTLLRSACGAAKPATAAEINGRLDSIVDMFMRAYAPKKPSGRSR
jgi:AcrR family transcriptional regulator